MHFHLPKPLHGWREFAGEVGRQRRFNSEAAYVRFPPKADISCAGLRERLTRYRQ
jgi:hypothetical protein